MKIKSIQKMICKDCDTNYYYSMCKNAKSCLSFLKTDIVDEVYWLSKIDVTSAT